MDNTLYSQWMTIVITMPDEVEHEADRIVALLDSGAADRVHLRKPQWSADRLARLIGDIPLRLHPQLQLHDHHELTRLFPKIGGVHLNSRNPQYSGREACLSTGFHSLEELSDADKYSYATLSPIFDSISKPGYNSRFDTDALRPYLANKRILALGGVRPRDFYLLKQIGFKGAALLGYVWSNFETALGELLKHKALVRNFGLQFITNGKDIADSLHQIENALKGGCRWIQIRMKDASVSEIALTIAAAKPVCKDFGATLLVDDNVELAQQFGIGVHLGKNDMPASQARQILGSHAIIGSTCNTADDLQRIFAAGASDYVGLGPFRFTHTKKNLSPVLGTEGYRYLLQEKGLHRLPVVAIGGITAADVAEVLSTGADGIAVSGEIIQDANPIEATKHLISLI